MQKAIIFLSFVLITATASAQKTKMAMGYNYTTAVGVKYYPVGVSVKSFTKQNVALEGLAYFYNYGTRFTGLYEYHHDVTGADGLKWYAGPGVHVGFWSDKWKNKYPTRDGGLMLGVDGVIGLDYKVKGAPVNVSLDWQPSFNFVGYNYFEGGWGGLGIRYAF